MKDWVTLLLTNRKLFKLNFLQSVRQIKIHVTKRMQTIVCNCKML